MQRGLGARAHIDVNRNQLWMENTGRRSGARLGGEASGVRTQLSPHWIGLMWQQAAKVYSSPRWDIKTLWVLTLESINLKIFETIGLASFYTVAVRRIDTAGHFDGRRVSARFADRTATTLHL